MKSMFKKISAVLIIIALISGLFVTSYAANLNDTTGYIANNEYHYSITPTTAPETWKSFTTHDEMLKACQIPDNLLTGMSTSQLLNACIDYPLFGDVWAYDSMQIGLDAVSSKFNGIQELLKRPDFGDVTVKYFENLDLSSLKTEDLSSIKLPYICALVSKSISANSFSLTEYTGLMQKSISLVKEIKTTYPDYYSTSELMTVIDLVSSRDSSSKQTNDYYTTIYTPMGSAVTAIYFTTDITPAQVTANNNYVTGTYPNATLISGTTTKYYNCHAYAWYSQSTSTHAWIQAPDQQAFWTDGSNSLFASWTSGQTWPSVSHGDKVRYVSDDHSARVYNASSFISKWGQCGVVIHPAAYCPYTCTSLGFYH